MAYLVIQNVPDDLDSRLALAEIYERLDMREEALQLVNEGAFPRVRHSFGF